VQCTPGPRKLKSPGSRNVTSKTVARLILPRVDRNLLTTGPKSVKRTQYIRHTSAHTTIIYPYFHQRQGQKVSNEHSTIDSLLLTLQVCVHNFTNDRAGKYQTNTIHSTHFYSHYMYISRISLTTGPKSIKPTQYTRHTSAHSTCICP